MDYRPRFFNYRAILSINTFMISTTLSSTNLGCTVRFVAEDGTISIAPHTPPGEFKFKNENKISSLPSSNLVCVFEFALFEISLREYDKVTEFAPKNDGRAAMNGAHLRVCSDSCMALGNLCAYMAAEGDLAPLQESEFENSDPVSKIFNSVFKIAEIEFYFFFSFSKIYQLFHFVSIVNGFIEGIGCGFVGR